jgi:hypothetical protein
MSAVVQICPKGGHFGQDGHTPLGVSGMSVSVRDRVSALSSAC